MSCSPLRGKTPGASESVAATVGELNAASGELIAAEGEGEGGRKEKEPQ